jgi:peptide/nickel transport system substrate-binding protein
VDDLTFTLTLRDSFGLVLEAFAKPLSNALFVMPRGSPERRRRCRSRAPSAPGFVKEEWRPCSKAVDVRNPTMSGAGRSPTA